MVFKVKKKSSGKRCGKTNYTNKLYGATFDPSNNACLFSATPLTTVKV